MEKIVHVGYAKLTLENWATSSFLGVYQSLTFKKKQTNAFTVKPFAERKFTVIYVTLPSFNSVSC